MAGAPLASGRPVRHRAASLVADVVYTALAVAFMLACAAIGLARPGKSTAAVAAWLATAMVCAQFALLLTR